MSAAVGGNSGGVQCGNPKITRSTNLVNWTTCSPYPAANEPYTHSDWPQTAFASNDGLYIAMYNGDDQQPAFGVSFSGASGNGMLGVRQCVRLVDRH